MRFLRGPFAALLARMAALRCFPVVIVPLRLSRRIPQSRHIRRGFVSRVALIWRCMELSRPPLVVAFELSEKRKAIVADALAGTSAIVYLTELDEATRAEALRNAGALLTFNTSKELRSGEPELLGGALLIQFMIAGVDFIPLGELPEGVPVATNGGGNAESMAEHALAMALAAAKRLIVEHENLKHGQFNQFTRNRMLAGGICGILLWINCEVALESRILSLSAQSIIQFGFPRLVLLWLRRGRIESQRFYSIRYAMSDKLRSGNVMCSAPTIDSLQNKSRKSECC